MVDLAFRDLPGVSVDPGDLDDGCCLDNYRFDDLYAGHGECVFGEPPHVAVIERVQRPYSQEQYGGGARRGPAVNEQVPVHRRHQASVQAQCRSRRAVRAVQRLGVLEYQ